MESPRKHKVLVQYFTAQREAVQEILPTLPLQTLKALRRIRGSVIGEEANIYTPFGRKCCIYADYAATGRCSSLVEDFLESKVYPFFAKGSAKSSYVARHTSALREEARALILKHVAQDREDLFTLLFLANPLQKLIQLLAPRPIVVFLTNTEHPSIVALWKQALNVRLEIISGDHDKGCDFVQLQEKAKQAASKFPSAFRVGFFSAGSLTGRYFDVDRIAAICHKHGTKVCIDYSSVCGYVDIQVAGESALGFLSSEVDLSTSCYKDVAILAPHKMIGGPGSSGVLIMRRDLLKKGMSEDECKELIETHEGQAPNYLADIRAGLAIRIRDDLGVATIMALSRELVRSVRDRALSKVSFHSLDAGEEHTRVPYFLVTFKTAFSKPLHYNFACALLNDLFGIQTRGSIASPTAGGQEINKRGFVVLSFSYLWDKGILDYVLDALEFVAEYGWMFLPKYIPSQRDAQWIHMDSKTEKQSTLASFSVLGDSTQSALMDPPSALSLQVLLQALQKHYLEGGVSLVPFQRLKNQEQLWFLTPHEARTHLLMEGLQNFQFTVPERLEKAMQRHLIRPSPRKILSTKIKPRLGPLRFHVGCQTDPSSFPDINKAKSNPNLRSPISVRSTLPTLPSDKDSSGRRLNVSEISATPPHISPRREPWTLMMRSSSSKNHVSLTRQDEIVISRSQAVLPRNKPRFIPHLAPLDIAEGLSPKIKEKNLR